MHHILKKQLKTAFLLCALLLLCILLTGAASENKPANEQRSSSAAAKQQVTLFFGGDIMCQYKQQDAAKIKNGYDFHYAFDYVRNLIRSADIAVGNLETCVSPSHPLGSDQKKKYGKPYLNAPSSFLPAVKKAGFDVLLGSNNHNADTGVKGLKETISKIDKNGFKRTGIYKNGKEKRYLILQKNGIKIGIASYATYFNRSIQDFTPQQQEKYLNYYSEEKMRRDVRNMKKDGADYIFVYFHSGIEYTDEASPKQIRIAREIANSGADYILCSHSHTVQPYTVLTGKNGKKIPVLYGMGNFISHMNKDRSTTYATMLSLTLTKQDGKVRLTEEGYYPLRTLKYNQETGKSYQLVPCTEASIASFKNRTVINRLKIARKEIASVVGSKVKQY